MFEDLREYIEWLQSSDKLHKVNKKVSSDCEITEIVTRMIEKNGPTLLFENVDDIIFLWLQICLALKKKFVMLWE